MTYMNLLIITAVQAVGYLIYKHYARISANKLYSSYTTFPQPDLKELCSPHLNLIKSKDPEDDEGDDETTDHGEAVDEVVEQITGD